MTIIITDPPKTSSVVIPQNNPTKQVTATFPINRNAQLSRQGQISWIEFEVPNAP